MQQRIAFIDTAKGLCILLVVIFHAGIDLGFHPVAALRMPFYFVLCGLFFKEYGGLWNMALRKVNKLVIPFLFFESLEIIIYYGNIVLKGHPMPHDGFLGYFALPLHMFHPVWFLMTLFWMNLIYGAIRLWLRAKWMRPCAVLLCGLGGYTLSLHDVWLPLYIAPALTALPFFFLGVTLKKTPLPYPDKRDKWLIPCGLALIAACWLSPPVELVFWSNRIHTDIGLVYLGGACMVTGFLMLCKKVGRIPVVSYFGKYSIVVLCTHNIVLMSVGWIWKYLAPSVSPNRWIVVLITSGVCAGLIPLCRRFIPWFTAQKDLIKTPGGAAEPAAGTP